MQRNKYEELRNDRTLATVRVLPREEAMGDMWQLLWTIKRHRDPSGRKFFTVPASNLTPFMGTDI